MLRRRGGTGPAPVDEAIGDLLPARPSGGSTAAPMRPSSGTVSRRNPRNQTYSLRDRARSSVSSNTRIAGSPSRAAAMPRRCLHAERVAADPAARHVPIAGRRGRGARRPAVGDARSTPGHPSREVAATAHRAVRRVARRASRPLPGERPPELHDMQSPSTSAPASDVGRRAEGGSASWSTCRNRFGPTRPVTTPGFASMKDRSSTAMTVPEALRQSLDGQCRHGSDGTDRASR